MKSDNSNKIFERIPAIYAGKRVKHPAESFVLIGYCKGEEHLNWINRTGLYNFRMNTTRGSLRLKPQTAGADYILLHSKGNLISGNIRRITEKGPRVFSKDKLQKLNYPSPNNDFYLVYQVEKTAEAEFNNLRWDISKLDNFNSGRNSATPFTVSLLELMRTTFTNPNN